MLRRYRIWITFLFTYSTIVGQDYERVDASIELYPTRFSNVEELSRLISRDFTSEEDKVRAIYTWIIQNVAYEPDEYKQFNYNFKNYRERNAKEEKTREKVIQRTIDKGIAVCEGYAMLFERLCELQGISSYLVRGDIKTHFKDIGRPFKKLHMWNVATIDGTPYLFDPTWGAGKYNGGFIKEPTYFYYKTAPELFVKTHYPQLSEDAFMTSDFTREDFAALPLLIWEKLEIKDVIRPKMGVISSLDDDGQIDFEIRDIGRPEISYSFGKETKKVEWQEVKGGLTFSIPLELGSTQLLIYFNDRPAIAYKIE